MPTPENELTRPSPAPWPAPCTEGGGGTTCTPWPESAPTPLPPGEPLAPGNEGGGGTTREPTPPPITEPMRPPARFPDRRKDGAGGTAKLAALPSTPCPMPVPRFCSCIGSCGDGPTTWAGPILMSTLLVPKPRPAPRSVGGGPTTVALGAVPVPARLPATEPRSGAGGITEACSRPGRRLVAWPLAACWRSGAGATTEVGPEGTFSCERAVAESGTDGSSGSEPAILGPRSFVLISGGAA